MGPSTSLPRPLVTLLFSMSALGHDRPNRVTARYTFPYELTQREPVIVGTRAMQFFIYFSAIGLLLVSLFFAGTILQKVRGESPATCSLRTAPVYQRPRVPITQSLPLRQQLRPTSQPLRPTSRPRRPTSQPLRPTSRPRRPTRQHLRPT